MVFAIKFQEINILLTDSISPKSKVLFDRNIRLRVSKIAPFLHYDDDPYIVLSQGKLYWIMDAYTTSSMYPYARPFQGNNNYIRNSVKVVVDAYSGEVRFYAVDTEDPFVKVYAKAFPVLFHSLTELSPELRSHFRYPVDLFMIQARLYGLYHMLTPQVFYNQEDLWVVPNESFGESVQAMEPYYAMLRLPEDKRLTFRLMMPFTPSLLNLIGCIDNLFK